MALDLFSSQKQSTSVRESQVGVQGGGEGSGTVGFGSIETGAKSRSQVVQGGGMILDASGGGTRNITFQSLDPLAIEAVAQSNLVVGEVSDRANQRVADIAAQSNLIVGEIAARNQGLVEAGFDAAQGLAAQSNALALQISDKFGSVASGVADVARQGINYANQSLIKALEALQIVSGGEPTETGALTESTLDLPASAKKSLKAGWIVVGIMTILILAGGWYFFVRRK